MTGARFVQRWGMTFRARLTRRPLAVGLLTAFLGGCSAFNPAFVDLIAPGEANTFVTLDPAPGHVVIAFVNNAVMGEQLIGYLDGPGGMNFTDEERRNLRPRIRARVRVTFVDGAQAAFEFIEGTRDVIDQRQTAFSVPDLSANDHNNAVVLCNVAVVEFLQGSVEVFMPVRLDVYELVDVNAGIGQINSEFRLREQLPPVFRPLQVDDTSPNEADTSNYCGSGIIQSIGMLTASTVRRSVAALAAALVLASLSSAQTLIRPSLEDGSIRILGIDRAILASPDNRDDLPCTVTPAKARLGFDLQFTAGYLANVPLDATHGKKFGRTAHFL